jgi:hypothetical protein
MDMARGRGTYVLKGLIVALIVRHDFFLIRTDGWVSKKGRKGEEEGAFGFCNLFLIIFRPIKTFMLRSYFFGSPLEILS